MSAAPLNLYDFQEPYLRSVLGFIGVTYITVFRAEGLNDPSVKDTAFEKAEKTIEEALA